LARSPLKHCWATNVPEARIPESVLARIWNDGWHSRELRSVDGRRIAVVYRGIWTHSDGPDFRDAMLEIDGRLVTGAIELHVRASDWNAHSHQHNPAYDDVVAHVVLENDLPEPCSGPSGKRLETIDISAFLNGSIDSYMATVLPVDLGSLGSQACLPTLAAGRPELVHDALRQAGWRRMSDKQLRYQQAVQQFPPAEVLYRGMLDSLGLTANRSGMQAVAERLPIAMLDRVLARYGESGVMATLLGMGGFLPLSPGLAAALDGDVSIVDIERVWRDLREDVAIEPLASSVWNLNRVRPLNHPVRRLASMASIISLSGVDGLMATFLEMAGFTGSGWDGWLASARPAIGASRRHQIIVNTFAPFFAAYAEAGDHEDLQQAIGPIWTGLAGSVDDGIARRTLRQITGGKRFPVKSAIEVQGLHQIGRFGCEQLRCFECPIASLAEVYEQGNG
jgi:hypothetical protein